MSEMWDSVAPVLDLAAGPGGAGLAAAQRVGSAGRVVLSDVAAEMVAVAAKRASAEAQVSTAVFDQGAIDFGDASLIATG
jgi:ubiquinone/menaquinone biosynthesis C-methylase UbiE